MLGFTEQYLNATITVNENRASTDDSLKLLQEMQEKARQSVIAEMRFDDNVLNGVCLVYQSGSDFRTGRLNHHYDLKFSINGKEYLVSGSIDPAKYFFDSVAKDYIYLLKVVKDEALAIIADHLFTHFKLEFAVTIGVIKEGGYGHYHIKNSL